MSDLRVIFTNSLSLSNFFFFSETRDILNLAICSSNFINLLTFFLPLSFFSSADMRNTAVCATFQR